MKRILLLATFVLLVPIAAYAQDCTGAAAVMKHIYHPDRLVEQKGCITVNGVIMKKLREKDGDIHIRVKLDAVQPNNLDLKDLLNPMNKSKQGGFLVVEPICVGKVTQADAIEACKNWKQNITVPNVGDHVAITGIHVLDTEHGWLEIHPVTKFEALAPAPLLLKTPVKHTRTRRPLPRKSQLHQK